MPLPLLDRAKALLDNKPLLFAWRPLVSHVAKSRNKGVHRVFHDSGVWIHDTSGGYFAYHHPYIRLDMAHMDEMARLHFFWGYRPQPGDVVVDVGAGVG